MICNLFWSAPHNMLLQEQIREMLESRISTDTSSINQQDRSGYVTVGKKRLLKAYAGRPQKKSSYCSPISYQFLFLLLFFKEFFL
jgi:hypothetical protein